MIVSIFASPELIITELAPYLPAKTDGLVIGSTCPMRTAAFGYAYEHGIPFTEIATDIFYGNTLQSNIYNILEKLLAQSQHLVIFSTHYSEQGNHALAYCTQHNISYTAFALNPLVPSHFVP